MGKGQQKSGRARSLTACKGNYCLAVILEKGLLLVVFFLGRIALLTNFFVLGRFNAAFVSAFLARLLGIVAAAGLEAG
jgi:hypothetical protein